MDDQNEVKNSQSFVDRFGAVASTACAIHCAICALAPATFAALGVGFLVGHEVEWALTLVAVGFGLLALYYALKSHKDGVVIGLLALGIIGLLAVRGLEGGHHDEHDEGGHAEAEDHGEAEEHADEKEKHADEKENPEEANQEEGHEEGEGHGDEHHDDHGSGEAVGILAGLILMGGHVRNLKVMSRKDCSD